MTDDPMVGDLLRDTRTELGVSQAELARRAGTKQSAISRMECGRISPTFATLARLMQALGLELVINTRRK